MSLFRRSEMRSIDSPVLREFATGDSLSPLVGNSLEAALRLQPLYSATSLIADSLCCLPFSAYETQRNARRRLTPQPDLVLTPHPYAHFTKAEWIHQFATSYLLRGNAYGLITALDDRGVPSKVMWLDPDQVAIDERSATPGYFLNGKEIDRSTLLHIPWYPKPGSVRGLSPVALFKAQIETGAAAVRFGNNWFRQGAAPSGHLKFSAGVLDPEQSAVAKTRFKAAVAGNDVFVSGNDWDWKAMSVPADEAQFLETIKATANQIAAIYRVNPEDVGGEAGNSLQYSTVELNQIKFQTRALQPIFTRLELHLSRLLPEFQYVKFNPDAIVRTDLLTRMQAHEIALRTAMETQDEGRALEDKAPLTSKEREDWKESYAKSAPAPAAPADPNAPAVPTQKTPPAPGQKKGGA
jgi:HK97 family phage portal protein